MNLRRIAYALLVLIGLLAGTLSMSPPTVQADETTTYLSDIAWVSATNGWGPVERDQSNGEQAAGDGRQISLGGTAFDKGLGVHAESDIRYDLSGRCQFFRTWIGIDDAVGSAGSVVFVVYLDGRMEYASDVMTGNSAPIKLDMPVSGVRELRLRVTSYDAIANDHADWANARVVCDAGGGEPPGPTATPPADTARFTLPGIVEAEDATAFADADPVNHGNVYRSDGLDVQRCGACARPGSDGYRVGWIWDGEWLAYAVQFAEAGAYRLRLRVAVPNYGRVVRVQFDGTDIADDVALPFTGSWQRWTLAESRVFTAPAGPATLRLTPNLGAFDLDMIEVVRVDPAAPTTTPTRTSQPTAVPTRTSVPSPTPSPPPDDPITRASAWERWEQTLTSTQSYANPYADVMLRVTYRGPDGTTLSTFGFWDGGTSFKIRAMFPIEGAWTWETECSDTSNQGLHNQRGTVQVRATGSANPLFTRGRLQVSANGRYLTHADGTPFFWLGDTAWDAPMQASEEEWRQYIDDRAAKGFSVIQIAPAASWFTRTDRSGNPPFLGEGIRQWNPAYWQGFERKVQYANERGLVVALFGVQDPIDDTWPSEADATRFARNIVARLYGNHVVFSPSFDKPYSELSDATGEALRAASSMHLITQHPGTPSGEPTQVWSEQYFDRVYLDIAGVQTGHNGGDRTLTTRQAIEWPLSLYRRAPPKPVVNLEAYYDANGSFPGGPGAYQGTAHDARSLGYLSLLSGASGYTYGARGLMVWQNDTGAREYWRNALAYPSSSQMTVLRDVFASVAWWALQPAHERILNQPADETRRMALAINSTGDLGVAYMPDNDSVQLDMTAFSRPVQATWINPVSGARQSAGEFADNNGRAVFARPGEGDWLLLFQAR